MHGCLYPGVPEQVPLLVEKTDNDKKPGEDIDIGSMVGKRAGDVELAKSLLAQLAHDAELCGKKDVFDGVEDAEKPRAEVVVDVEAEPLGEVDQELDVFVFLDELGYVCPFAADVPDEALPLAGGLG